MSALDMKVDIESMRGRDLRKFMIQKLGASPDHLNKIIDRRELKDLAWNLMLQKRRDVQIEAIVSNLPTALWMIGATIILFLFREAIQEYLSSVHYTVTRRFSLVRTAVRKRLPSATIAMLSALVLSLASSLITVSVILSWLGIELPIKFPVLSVPLNTSYVLGPASQRSSAVDTFRNYGLNIGPMITLWIMSYVRSKLENFGARILLRHSNDKAQ